MTNLRPICPSDLAACASLYASTYNAPPYNERWELSAAERRLGEIQRTPGSFGLVTVEDGSVIGFVLGYSQQWEDRRHFYVKDMLVRPDRQRRGVG